MPTPMKPVTSAAMLAHGYDIASRVLKVHFHSGKVVEYRDVPPEVADGLDKAESVGRFYSKSIRGQFEHSMVVESEEVTNSESTHE